MAKGIDFGSFEKNSKNKKGASKSKTSSNNKKKKGGSRVDTGQIIDGGFRILSDLTNLVTVINDQKQRTEQIKEETNQIKIQSDERIETLKSQLKLETDKMRNELERYKEDCSTRRKEIESEIINSTKILEKEIKEIDNLHERNMRMIDQQEKTLDVVLELYRLYYTRKINGENVGVDNPEDIVNSLNGCINNMKTYIKAINTPSNYIEADIIE